MSRTLTLELDDTTYRLFDEAAKAERRSLTQFIETTVLGRIRDQRTANAVVSEPSELQRAVDEAERGVAQGQWVEHAVVADMLRQWTSGG